MEKEKMKKKAKVTLGALHSLAGFKKDDLVKNVEYDIVQDCWVIECGIGEGINDFDKEYEE